MATPLKTLRNLALFALVAYAVICGTMYVQQRNFIFVPYKGKISVPDTAPENLVELTLETADGLELMAWYLPPANEAGRAIVYFHGNASHIRHSLPRAEYYASIAGDAVLLPEYRGYVGNPGTPSEAGLEMDADAAMSWLIDAGFAAEDIILYGRSLGTGPATYLAHRMANAGTPVGGLILESPFTSLPDVGARRYPFIPVRQLMHDHFPNLERIPDIAAPLFVMHGLQDRVIPQDMGLSILHSAANPKTGLFIDEAGHNNMYDYPAVKEAIAAFLSSAY